MNKIKSNRTKNLIGRCSALLPDDTLKLRNHAAQQPRNTMHAFKLRNLYDERVQRKESNSPRRLLTEGDAEDCFSAKPGFEGQRKELEKIRQIEKEWKAIKSALNNSNDSSNTIKHAHNLRNSKCLNMHMNKSSDDQVAEECNENASAQYVKQFKISSKCNQKKQYHKHFIPITKICLQNSNGVYINLNRTSENLLHKAKLACSAVERQKNYSYSDARDMFEAKCSNILVVDNIENYMNDPCKHKKDTKPPLKKMGSCRCGSTINYPRKEKRNTVCANYFKNMLLEGIKRSKHM